MTMWLFRRWESIYCLSTGFERYMERIQLVVSKHLQIIPLSAKVITVVFGTVFLSGSVFALTEASACMAGGSPAGDIRR